VDKAASVRWSNNTAGLGAVFVHPCPRADCRACSSNLNALVEGASVGPTHDQVLDW
jgi:hypothetical protein